MDLTPDERAETATNAARFAVALAQVASVADTMPRGPELLQALYEGFDLNAAILDRGYATQFDEADGEAIDARLEALEAQIAEAARADAERFVRSVELALSKMPESPEKAEIRRLYLSFTEKNFNKPE